MQTIDVIIGVVAMIILDVADVRDCSPILKKIRYKKKPNKPEIKNFGISCFLGNGIFLYMANVHKNIEAIPHLNIARLLV